MDNDSDVQLSLRKALVRNRMLHDILIEETQLSDDVLVQQRCLREVRRVSAARRWRRRVAVIAGVAAMIMASIGGSWLLTNRSLTRDQVVAVNEKMTSLTPFIPPLVTATNVPGFEMFHSELTAGLLQVIPTAAIRTYVTISSSNSLLADAAGSFSMVSTADLQMAQFHTTVSSSSLKGNFSESSTASLDTIVATISDDEFLNLPRVIGIVGYAGNQRVLLRSTN
jgi:hypothetical protein